MIKTPALFYRLPQSIVRCFSGNYLMLQLAAVGLSVLIVTTGFDWTYYESSRSTIIRTLIFPAITIGGLLPIIAPLTLLLFGIIRKRAYLVNAAWGLGQAAMLGLFLSSFYKAFTGRIPPHFTRGIASAVDSSHGFQFGFMRGGIFWGWPSSHATVACAIAVTFAILFPRQKMLKYSVLLGALYVAVGVSTSIHWLSEAVAGIIIGTAIGLVVGESFRRRQNNAEMASPSFENFT